MIGFHGRPWGTVGCKGSIYSDRANLQTTWETNWTQAGATSVLTDYAGGARGVAIGSMSIAGQVDAFLGDLNAVVPGASASAIRDGGGVRAARAHWPSSTLSRGSYTCYRPGQFTSIAGLEGAAAGRMKFAGEHADSFYSWQGFMEGACLSGRRAADEVLDDMRAGEPSTAISTQSRAAVRLPKESRRSAVCLSATHDAAPMSMGSTPVRAEPSEVLQTPGPPGLSVIDRRRTSPPKMRRRIDTFSVPGSFPQFARTSAIAVVASGFGESTSWRGAYVRAILTLVRCPRGADPGCPAVRKHQGIRWEPRPSDSSREGPPIGSAPC